VRRITVVAGLSAFALALPGAASASPITPVAKRIIGAQAPVSSCGALSGISVTWTSTNGVVTQIVLGSIPAGCNGGTLNLTLAGAANAQIGSASAPVAGTSLTLTTISGSPATASVTAVYVSVTAP
jgi:hypothetical protein